MNFVEFVRGSMIATQTQTVSMPSLVAVPCSFDAIHWYVPSSSCLTSCINKVPEDSTVNLGLPPNSSPLVFFLHLMWGLGAPVGLQCMLALPPTYAYVLWAGSLLLAPNFGGNSKKGYFLDRICTRQQNQLNASRIIPSIYIFDSF
jgi:hypothetical protein